MTNVTNGDRRFIGLRAATLAVSLAVGMSFVLPSLAFADPPDWAPAWGWRAKQGDYDDYYGSKHNKKHNKKHKQNYDDDDYEYNDDDDRVVYRRDVVRCDVRRRDGSIGDLAGVLIDRTLGIPDYIRDNCYVTRSDNQRGFYRLDPNLN